MNDTYPVCIYAKNKKAIALTFVEAQIRDSDLLSNGWEHTATVDGAKYINWLLNNSFAKILKNIKQMKGE